MADINKITELVNELLAYKKEIANFKESIKDIEQELLELDPLFSLEVSPECKVYGTTKKVYKINGEGICDLYSIPNDFRLLLSSASSAFKIGAIKKEDNLKDCWSQEDTGQVIVKQTNPEFIK